MKKLRLLGISFMIIMLGGLVFAFYNLQNISDWLRLKDYTPSTNVVALADNTTMNSLGTKLFYVSYPEVIDKNNFYNYCHIEEFSIILGCYLTGEQRIYILNVTDERLNGIKEVTAAHEMLHVAYARLSNQEKERIDKLLLDTYDTITDSRLIETIENYRKADPSVVTNELHSILGSEVRSLPSELEDYYKQYFTNRSKVVSYSERYEQAFIDRRDAIRDYDNQLSEMKTQIDALSNTLSTESQELNNLKQQLNTLRETDIPAYNSAVPDFNNRVAEYNNQSDHLATLIVSYNELVNKRNSVASEEAELIQAINSKDVLPERSN
ncbi:hypothetical protein KC867_01010 [Candidatus Saccharibacteria bacterium]|nr:hypothetical protein [Candidatus Saccharibacteria bacterium]